MHVQVANVHLIWLLVVGSAKASETFFENVGFDWVNAFDNDVQADVEFLVVDQQRILNVALHQILVLKSLLGQVTKFSYEANAFTTTAFTGLTNESLVWEVTHVDFQILNFIW